VLLDNWDIVVVVIGSFILLGTFIWEHLIKKYREHNKQTSMLINIQNARINEQQQQIAQIDKHIDEHFSKIYKYVNDHVADLRSHTNDNFRTLLQHIEDKQVASLSKSIEEHDKYIKNIFDLLSKIMGDLRKKLGDDNLFNE
jgi:hypothetical protein